VLLLVFLTGLVWGAGGVASKALVGDGVDPFVVTAIPFLVGAGLAWFSSGVSRAAASRVIKDGLILGAVNSALPALLFNLAYESLPAGIVALVLSLGPVFTAVAAHHAFDDEGFSRSKGAGLALCVGGVAALGFTPGLLDGASWKGAVLALTGSTVAGVSAIMARRLAVRHGARALVAPQLTAAGLTPLIVGVVAGRPLSPTGGWETWQLAAMVAIGSIASFGGFAAIMRANELGTTGQVSVVGYVIPIVGVTGGAVFLSESITPFTALGGLLILIGVAVVGRASAGRVLAAETSG
jgi:drug/metabolite transporter (DMT)-like permease